VSHLITGTDLITGTMSLVEYIIYRRYIHAISGILRCYSGSITSLITYLPSICIHINYFIIQYVLSTDIEIYVVVVLYITYSFIHQLNIS
jgi:hypothetical protein